MSRPPITAIEKSAIWSACLTVPFFLFGLYLLDVHGKHFFSFTAPLGFAIITPWAFIHDSGFGYRLGNAAFPIVFLAQWAWFFLPVHLVRWLYSKSPWSAK